MSSNFEHKIVNSKEFVAQGPVPQTDDNEPSDTTGPTEISLTARPPCGAHETIEEPKPRMIAENVS